MSAILIVLSQIIPPLTCTISDDFFNPLQVHILHTCQIYIQIYPLSSYNDLSTTAILIDVRYPNSGKLTNTSTYMYNLGRNQFSNPLQFYILHMYQIYNKLCPLTSCKYLFTTTILIDVRYPNSSKPPNTSSHMYNLGGIFFSNPIQFHLLDIYQILQIMPIVFF